MPALARATQLPFLRAVQAGEWSEVEFVLRAMSFLLVGFRKRSPYSISFNVPTTGPLAVTLRDVPPDDASIQGEDLAAKHDCVFRFRAQTIVVVRPHSAPSSN